MRATSRWGLAFFSTCLLAACLLAASGCSGDDSGFEPDASEPDAVAPQDSGGHADSSSGGHDASSNEDAHAPSDGGTGSDSSLGDAGTDAGGAGNDGGTAEGGAVPNDPIALWHFDEGSGSVALDSSGHGHTATLLGGATFAPGKHGTGLSPNATGWAVIPASIPDAGEADAGAPDADVSDGSTPDAADSEGGAIDAGSADANDGDGEALEAGAPDAGEDASDADASAPVDAAGPPDAATPFVPLVFDTTKSFSVVCWVEVYSQGAGQWQSAFSRDGKNLSVFTLKLRGDAPAPIGGERFDFDFPGADDTGTGIYTVAQSLTSPAVTVPDGGADQWYQVAGVFDSAAPDGGAASVNIYVNGVLEASAAPGTAPILEAVGDTIIGASLFGTRGASWNGVIDEVSLFDRALSASEVSALYAAMK
ncbi:MAG TPA: LamG-like jellyroll fold domain-containing protein [Polyangiaceae bacterium]|jgi:hypothetical protein